MVSAETYIFSFFSRLDGTAGVEILDIGYPISNTYSARVDGHRRQHRDFPWNSKIPRAKTEIGNPTKSKILNDEIGTNRAADSPWEYSELNRIGTERGKAVQRVLRLDLLLNRPRRKNRKRKRR